MEKTKKKTSLLGYAFKYAGHEKKNYIISIIIAAIGVIFSMLPFAIMGKMLTDLFGGVTDFSTYVKGAAYMAICWILRVFFHTKSTAISHKTTFRVIGEVRLKLCDKLSRLPLGTVNAMPSGSLKNILVERTDSIETALAHVVPEYTANLAAPVFMLIYLVIIDYRMALLSLVTIPIAILAMGSMFIGYEENFKRTQDTTKALNDIAVEYIGGIEVIKAFGKTEKSYEKFAIAATDNANSFIDWMQKSTFPFSLAMVVAPATLIALLPVGGIFVMKGSLTLTAFVQCIILATGLVTPFITLMSYNDDIRKSTVIFGDIDAVMALPELSRPEKGAKTPGNYDIQLTDVSFSYDEKEVLHGVNLTIPQGKVTSIVGPSGSGKSTIARLIASLWDTDNGDIEIGGVNIKDMSFKDYNLLVAYVSQDTFLFDTTVRENIRLGNPKASDREVEEVAKASGCYDFIMSLENGFDTMVGGSGAHLSGGEKQRISIARAMMKNAPILILDEATAYTDPENEAIIQKAISKLAVGKTLIVIAHRLSTIVDSDQIVVVNDGSIEACGTHENLLKDSALYQKMWDAHLSGRDSGEGVD